MKCLNCNIEFDGEGMICGSCHEQLKNGIQGNPDATMTLHPHKNHDTRNMDGSLFSIFNLFVEVKMPEAGVNLEVKPPADWKQLARAELAVKLAEYHSTH